MAIYAGNKSFHLTDEKNISLVLDVMDLEPHGEQVAFRYFGAALSADADLSMLRQWDKCRYSSEGTEQVAPYAYPVHGAGDYRIAALDVIGPDGCPCGVLNYEGYAIEKGKESLGELPTVYIESENEAETLKVYLRDRLTNLKVTLCITLHQELGVITQSVLYENAGNEKIRLINPASAAVTLNGEWDMLHLHGLWAQERQVERVKNMHGVRKIESLRGASGHQHNPFMALMTPDATEMNGECYGFLLLYSGSFRMETEENEHGSTRLVAGITACDWQLYGGESFRTPEIAMVYSGNGLNGCSQLLHRMIRTRVCRGYWRDKERPVLVNNWEGTYFDFNTEKLLDIARKAANIGVELFVLDDGWFGKRDNDLSSLGDWVVNEKKLPGGLSYLGKKINGMGLMFGIWVEPEMVSPVSDLYSRHPDWCMHVNGRGIQEHRHQLILDMTREDVQNYIIDAISNVLESAPISYVKWDMNRNFGEIGADLLRPEQQGEIHHRYILGLYHVLNVITSRFPQVLFESCASGGGRFDAGMLYYMPQTWTSDETDAVERMFIQYGTSIPYPPCSMGAHVTDVPNNYVHRTTSLQVRGAVALSGNFGYEMDLSIQSEEDLDVMREQVKQVKRLRKLTSTGRFTRMMSPFEGDYAAWQFSNEEQTELLVCIFRRYMRGFGPNVLVKVPDIDEKRWYRDDDGKRYQGSVLKHVGVPAVFKEKTDAASIVLHLTAE